LYHFHGVGTQVAADTTAFAMRRKHFIVEMIAAWEASARVEAAIHRRWMIFRRLSHRPHFWAVIRTSSRRMLMSRSATHTEITHPACANSSGSRPRRRLLVRHALADLKSQSSRFTQDGAEHLETAMIEFQPVLRNIRQKEKHHGY